MGGTDIWRHLRERRSSDGRRGRADRELRSDEQRLQRDRSRSRICAGIPFGRRSDGERRGAGDDIFYDDVHEVDEHGDGGSGGAGD